VQNETTDFYAQPGVARQREKALKTNNIILACRRNSHEKQGTVTFSQLLPPISCLLPPDLGLLPPISGLMLDKLLFFSKTS